ncbi:formimidoylglutamate deiminase [Methylobrevis pamukkalensis]|uniref:8-oxoguanine deaminase n=1 Tax=Methylobrevis pamukkalensis TaxID=1439726 RepID=A0A1E3H7T2_9HYPH|nr:formimidoylglutamate deiminase [Methylobrevis pamukkalensis]ODN72399.1 8-oxoguanine deaminase [Methylobrevis pamukkalensis]
MSTTAVRHLHARDALLPEGWAEDVRVGVDAAGRIAGVETGVAAAPGDDIAAGPVVPALVDLHSHAFQRAMAGLAEVAGPTEDSFWTWREEMYRIVGLLSPQDAEAVAARLYVDMLKAGFAHICEFHYLHHGADGAPHADPAEMSRRILAAKAAAGIGMTLLPVFYAHGNFGGAAPSPGQRRFLHDLPAFLALMETLGPACTAAGVRLGVAPHSLRAATIDEIRALLAALPADMPVHIHVAEQHREVDDCLAFCGRRPVTYLCDELPVDRRWVLIHATHINAEEVARIAQSGAVVGLCPTTEASLGDGIFPATEFLGQGGVFGVGTDSHVSFSPAEELRQLEYSQRLRDQRRVRVVTGPGRSNGRTLYDTALAGGWQAAGERVHGLRVGAPASLLVLDGEDAFLAAARGDTRLDRWIFALGDRAVRDVMVEGVWRIADRRHADDAAIDAAFAAAIARLSN